MVHVGNLVFLFLVLVDFSDNKKNTLKNVGTIDH